MSDAFLNGAEFDLAPFEGKPKRPYMICSTGRSGSTLLCSLLTNTKVAGVPHEYFNMPKHGQPMIQRLNTSGKTSLNLEEYLNAIVKRRTSSNGVFGIKSHINQCLSLFNRGEITSYFGKLKYIFIRRRDSLGQAISLAIASKTNSWTSHEEMMVDPEYSFEDIESGLSIVTYQNYLWEHLFDINAISPLVVYYEDLLLNSEKEIHRVLEFLGIGEEIPVTFQKAGLERQASNLNEEWRKRFNDRLLIK